MPSSAQNDPPWLIAIVDDDAAVRESLAPLLRQLGFNVHVFASANVFLESDIVSQTQCLVMDVEMPVTSGPMLQQELARQGRTIPIVFITGHTSEVIRQQLLNAGAVAVLFKPFAESALMEAVEQALQAR